MVRESPWIGIACCVFLLGVRAQALPSAQEARRGPDTVDVESTRAIREATTETSFLTEWVDYVPQSDTVPSPRDFLGYAVGTGAKLTSAARIVAYFKELARTSDRVQVLSMGTSHGGREMILAAIGDAELLARLPEIRAGNRRLGDPRGTSKAEAQEIAATLPATYYITAGLHSPETGPPEMVMELAYRLAVSEAEHIREIRAKVLTLITPVLEMDGRERTVDWHNRYLQGYTELEDTPPRSPPYWGDYTFHDNNRDGLPVSQPLTRNFVQTFHEFLPTVSLDLHESVPLLYVSTGTGPYNETIDPIAITEWQWMASYDVNLATRFGLRGVWTWGFYTGWYPGYLLWVTNNHNSVGRFYETFGNSLAGTFSRKLKGSRFADERVNARAWYRAWPPEKELRWSLRNNTNYMQTGVLASLQLAARNSDTLLLNFWQKGFNSLEKGKTLPPFAFHVPAEQRDKAKLHHLLWLLDRHAIEVHQAADDVLLADGVTIPAGDYVVRMDQPYRNFAKTLLSKQVFPKNAAHTPYDDVAWSLDYMLGLEIEPVNDKAVFQGSLTRLEEIPALPGDFEAGSRWIVDHRGQANLAGLCWALAAADVRALSKDWESHPAGSLIIEGADAQELKLLARSFHVDVRALEPGSTPPETVEVDLPRVALYHTWTYTQDSGWARYTLEQLGVPYTLIAKDDLRAGGLNARFDVIVVPDQGGRPFKAIVHGIDPKWGPMPYTQTPEYPSHGVIDATDDITGGMGFEGLGQLDTFVRSGGLLITLGGSGVLAADSGIAREVTSSPPSGTPGSHVTAKVLRREHPVTWGYAPVTHVFHGNERHFTVPEYRQGLVVMQYGTRTMAQAEREADKKDGVEVGEPEPQDKAAEGSAKQQPELCLSGSVPDPSALERKPALLDVPVGEGRVLLFTWNPLHRHQNHHDFSFLTNALLFHDDFPGTPTEKEMRAREE